jgi:hypothetical protein
MLGLLVGLIFVCLLIYLAWWAISQIPLPQPVRVVAVVLLALICIYMLLSYFPVGGLGLHRVC